MKELALLFGLTAAIMAQEFEVASIHRAVEDFGANIHGDKGHYRVHNFTLKRLIAMAWGVDGSEVIGGPNWVGSDHWDITAKMPAEYATRPQDQFLKKMIQNLLADRFRLTIHRETRQVSGFALVVAKNGPKMAVATPHEENQLQGDNRYLKATDFTMEELAHILSVDGRLVVDKTGLTGGYDFEIHCAMDNDSSSDQPSIFTALQEQLGLKLESAKIPIQAVVIDRADKPKEN
jgi:uncharacterized protein (TIGR03435 family)